MLRILDRLAIDPVLTAETAARNHGVSTVAAHGALAQLSAAGILSRNKDHKGRLFCWTADEHLAHVALTERSNRIGGGDTLNEVPRHGPARPDTRVVGRLLR